jgi:hypothetical protein
MVALLRTILGNAVNDATTFRTRFRFRVLKTLDIKEHEYRFKVGEREVVLSPLPEGVPIRESEWLVINVRGFDSEDAARTFAHKLRAASEISSVAARLGIDAGRDLPTGGFGQTVKDHFQKTTGLLLRDNIHGIDVFLDDPKCQDCSNKFNRPGLERTESLFERSRPFPRCGRQNIRQDAGRDFAAELCAHEVRPCCANRFRGFGG